MTSAARPRSRWSAGVSGVVLLLLLSVSQIAASLHDVDHPFHANQSLCDVFLGAHLHAPGGVAVSTLAVPAAVRSAPAAIFRPVVARRPHVPQQPRAPPVPPTR